MRKAFEIGGIVAAVVLIAFGIGALVLGISGRTTVRDGLRSEQIVGSEDMTPAAIAAEAKAAGLPSTITLPTMDIAGKAIDNGDRARAFASYMRIHALESSGGLTYSQMGRFIAAENPNDPAGTSDEAAAAKDASGAPIANAARNTWVTETALATALNVSYMAEKTALFGIVVGIALLLIGVGFAILAVGGALRKQRAPAPTVARSTPVTA